ncbi:MAG: tRNA (adenosine(37)-N6)-threonylcarbamoyltransferase complex dimerization subunit type 1 TsaB [Bacteroidales bacterium]|jgi:tRNA threonylcarbamoyladenosine biosynthesis protein TsaB|nr:tRNA (adenosine(37)-N6)-threonylcarbamoyltransferase complex dimerization subunit type 1 TsaB [Bacteroidales bacterium]
MTFILNIETATPVCSVALYADGKILSQKTGDKPNIHSEKLTLFIEETIKEGNLTFRQLDAVAVSEGPGSYTGLRIGASAAKGLCYALDIPLIAVSTLQAMAVCMKRFYKNGDVLYCPMIDARRKDVYTALYNAQGEPIDPISAKTINEHTFQDILSRRTIIFGGDGAEKCREIINSSNALFLNNFKYTAEGVAALSHKKWERREFTDTAYFEPFYLKEFQAGKPKVKGLYDTK